jgi:Fic family protein
MMFRHVPMPAPHLHG